MSMVTVMVILGAMVRAYYRTLTGNHVQPLVCVALRPSEVAETG